MKTVKVLVSLLICAVLLSSCAGGGKPEFAASEATEEVNQYLVDSFGEVMLSGQMESTWMGSPDYEMDIIEQATGKLPAIRGLDFMNGDFDGVVERAKQWWEKGGIVTVCWHTGINGAGYEESKNDTPDFDKLFDESTPEHKAMIENWDQAAEALSKLKDAGVPVLWRPFHEFDGQWFWWGKGGGDNFVKLWKMMHDRFTNEFGLDNLIWVLGYSGDVKDGWYPGDEYCDVVGSDTYDNSTHKKAFERLEKLNTQKPLAFHECGYVPEIENFVNDGCLWSWFMVWHTDFISNYDKTELNEVYNDEKVITLDELPEWGSKE